MGSFVLAAFAGLLAAIVYSRVDLHNQHHRSALSAAGAVLLLIALTFWAAVADRSTNLRDVLDSLGGGYTARVLIGAILGFAAPRILAKPGPSWHQLATALTLFLFACAAPHIDRWLSRLSGFKSSVFEFQLASTATANHKIAVAEGMEGYASSAVFYTLKNYYKSIENDIDYIKEVEIPLLEKTANKESIEKARNVVKAIEEIRPAFLGLVKPLSECIDKQIDGGMNIDRVRTLVRPISVRLQQIVLNDGDLSDDGQHINLWNKVLNVPARLDKVRLKGQPSCRDAGKAYIDAYPSTANEVWYPRISKSQNLPYLYVSAALLVFLSGETPTALAILEAARPQIAFHDHKLFALIGTFRGFMGQPAARIVEPLEAMRQLAIERQARLKAHCEKKTCGDDIKDIISRERLYELVAMNNMAMAIAVDLARGVRSAKELEATAEKYASKLQEVVEKESDEDSANAFTDTYAYTFIVIEAQKSLPDRDKVKKYARVLRGLVEKIEQRLTTTLENGRHPSKALQFHLHAARVHYNAARELAGD